MSANRFSKQTLIHDAPRIIGHGNGRQYHFPSIRALNKYLKNECAQFGYRVSITADDNKKKKFYPEINFSDTGIADIYFAIELKHFEIYHASNGRDYLKYNFANINGENQHAFNDLIDAFDDSFKHISKYHFNDIPIGKFYIPNILVPIVDGWQEKCFKSNQNDKLLIKIYQIVCHPQTRGVLDCECKFALAKKLFTANPNSNSININNKRKLEIDEDNLDYEFEQEQEQDIEEDSEMDNTIDIKNKKDAINKFKKNKKSY